MSETRRRAMVSVGGAGGRHIGWMVVLALSAVIVYLGFRGAGLQKEVDRLQGEIVRARRQNDGPVTGGAESERLGGELAGLRLTTEKAKDAAERIAAKYQAATDQVKALLEQRKTLLARAGELERQLKFYREAYPDPEIIPEVNGTILRIDDESGLLVVKIGVNNGVRRGLGFIFSRDGKDLAKGRVVRVGPDFVIVAVSDDLSAVLKVGDAARTR